MKQEILNLIDKVVGKKGIMRSPAWFVNKLFKKTLDYAEEVGKSVMKYTDYKTDEVKESIKPYIIYAAKTGSNAPSLDRWQKQANSDFFHAVKNNLVSECKLKVVGSEEIFNSAKIIFTPYSSENGLTVNAHVEISFLSSQTGRLGIAPLPITAFSVIITEDGAALLGVDDQLGHISIINNLNSKDTTAALSAKQGMVLREMIEGLPNAGVEVIDNLESESTTAALSANQGRVLAERIGDIDSILDSINGEEV